MLEHCSGTEKCGCLTEELLRIAAADLEAVCFAERYAIEPFRCEIMSSNGKSTEYRIRSAPTSSITSVRVCVRKFPLVVMPQPCCSANTPLADARRQDEVAVLTLESAQSERSRARAGLQPLKRCQGRTVPVPCVHESPEQSNPRSIPLHFPK